MGSDKTYKTTAKHFAVFKAQVQKELDRFGLKQWRVGIEHEERDDDARAEVCWSLTGRCATIYLNTIWRGDITEENLRMTAFHEVIELLMAPVYYMAYKPEERMMPGQREVAASAEQHGIIRTLENVFGYAK